MSFVFSRKLRRHLSESESELSYAGEVTALLVLFSILKLGVVFCLMSQSRSSFDSLQYISSRRDSSNNAYLGDGGGGGWSASKTSSGKPFLSYFVQGVLPDFVAICACEPTY